ncbi:MAG TPA: hypothetical protein VJN01_16495, partial [Xanthomonadales bacterium]|nr:hypothetical protein [Xanthomonadales bacterium]
ATTATDPGANAQSACWLIHASHRFQGLPSTGAKAGIDLLYFELALAGASNHLTIIWKRFRA